LFSTAISASLASFSLIDVPPPAPLPVALIAEHVVGEQRLGVDQICGVERARIGH